MNVSIAYAESAHQLWREIEVPEDSTVADVIERAGLLERFPDIDLSTQKVGIFGKLTKLSAPVKPGDRVEIYRAIIADPMTVRRRDTATDE